MYYTKIDRMFILVRRRKRNAARFALERGVFMKKLFLLLLALCTVLTLAACGEEDDHNFATKWESDATDHWHVCEDEGCTEIEGKAAHTFTSKGVTKAAVGTTAGEETMMCSVCAYTQTKPFAAITQEAWTALFAVENVKITGVYGDQTVEVQINGNIVFATDGEYETYPSREDVMSTLDFSANLANFSTFDGKTYDATSVTIDSDVFKNVKITVDDGKITSIAYTVEYDGGEPEAYTFTFSDWGNVTVTLPTLSADAWATAIDSMNFNNYSVDLVTKPAAGEWTFEWFQFNGNEYYHWINYTTNQSGDTVGDNGTQENAGLTMTPGLLS